MTRDELRLSVMDSVLRFVASNQIEQIILASLKQANGDVEQAFIILKQSEFGLVHGGFSGPHMFSWDWFGGWGSKCRCWFPDRAIGSRPDVQFGYKELIKYVKLGKPKMMQGQLF